MSIIDIIQSPTDRAGLIKLLQPANIETTDIYRTEEQEKNKRPQWRRNFAYIVFRPPGC
ncbi:hypothetical protein BY996DRAFT_6579268 [Phakopsora pachyrhizi]|nr:hypothetical protein BY996DRAFT_6579268 [Phakopsora pachyrhizi]